MKKRDALLTILLVGVFFISFASAGWFSDTWNFITGHAVASCTDSDGGWNYYVKGTVSYVTSNGGSNSISDSCDDSVNVRERICKDGTDWSGPYSCPNGCKDGACINTTASAIVVQNTTVPTCVDSDGGLNYYVKGNASITNLDAGSTSTMKDGCFIPPRSNSTRALLSEAICLNNSISTKTYDCPGSCVDGACVNTTTPTCVDSDGGLNYYVKGTAKATGAYDATDVCAANDGSFVDSSNKLLEYSCDTQGSIFGAYYNCSNGCVDGACVNTTTSIIYEFPASVNVPVILFKTGVQGTEYTLSISSVLPDKKSIFGSVQESNYGDEEPFYNISVPGKFEFPNSDFAFKLLNVSDSGKEILLSSNYYACSNPQLLAEGNVYSFTNSFGSSLEVSVRIMDGSQAKVMVNGYDSNSLNDHSSFVDSNGNTFVVKDIFYSARESTVDKVELCLPQGFFPPKPLACEATTNFMKAPTDITIEGITWRLNYNYSSVYGTQQKYYSSFSQDNDYSSGSVSVNEYVSNDILSVERYLNNSLESGLCQQQRIYTNYETQEYQVAYVCKDIWQLAEDSKNIVKDNTNQVVAFWISGNRLFRVYSYNYDFGRCSSYEDCMAQDEQQHRQQQTQTVEFLSKLVDNKENYVGGFYLDWTTQQFVNYLLTDCKSDVKETGYVGSWMCKQEPVICPPHGEQKETCTRWNSNLSKYDTREATISCNPGICSGCMVPKWIDYPSDSKCIQYGFRFEQKAKQEYTFTLDVKEGSGNLGSESLVINSDTEAVVTFYGGEYYENVSYTLREGEQTYISSMPGVFDFPGLTWKVLDVSANSVTIQGSFSTNFPAYCDIDGQVKQQKVPDWNNEWAKCQNNYECSSNLCSDGECIELKAIANELTGFKGFIIKMLCRLSNPFSEDGYAQCLSNNI